MILTTQGSTLRRAGLPLTRESQPTPSSVTSLRSLSACTSRSTCKRLAPSQSESCTRVNTPPCRLASAIHSAERRAWPRPRTALSGSSTREDEAISLTARDAQLEIARQWMADSLLALRKALQSHLDQLMWAEDGEDVG